MICGVLNKISQEYVLRKRNFALLSLMVKCGLRICEVVRANVEDLRNGRGSIYKVKVKTKRANL